MTSMTSLRRPALWATAFMTLPLTAHAASTTSTGIDASFSTLLTDLDGMLGGNFGALVLVVSLIIGLAIYGITSNFRYMVASIIAAFAVGYGVDIVQGIGGVTASVDMIDVAVLAMEPATPALHPTVQ